VIGEDQVSYKNSGFENRPSIVSLEQVSVWFGDQPILNQISLSLKEGEFLGLIGPSGAGKSTLLKCIAGIVPISNGQVTISENLRMSLMFQEGALFDSFSVFDNVCFPLVSGKVPASLLTQETKDRVAGTVTAILDRVGLAWAAHKMPNELSGGMKRRVSLARALVTSPHLALLDDPTSGLDPVASSIIMDLILEMQQELKSTIVVASHDLRRLIPRSTKLMCLWGGEVAFEGNMEDLCNQVTPTAQHLAVQNFVHCRFEW